MAGDAGAVPGQVAGWPRPKSWERLDCTLPPGWHPEIAWSICPGCVANSWYVGCVLRARGRAELP